MTLPSLRIDTTLNYSCKPGLSNSHFTFQLNGQSAIMSPQSQVNMKLNENNSQRGLLTLTHTDKQAIHSQLSIRVSSHLRKDLDTVSPRLVT